MHFVKLVLMFAGILLVEAALYTFIMLQTSVHDDALLLLFFGLWAFFGGITTKAVLSFIGITVGSYLAAGFVLTLIYLMLKKILSKRNAFIVALLVPVFMFAVNAYIQVQEHREFFKNNVKSERVNSSSVEEIVEVVEYE